MGFETLFVLDLRPWYVGSLCGAEAPQRWHAGASAFRLVDRARPEITATVGEARLCAGAGRQF